MRKLYYRKFCQLLTLLLVVIGISHQARAQSTTITGRVTTTDGAEPLPGVSVVVKGTTDGTITDVDGKYSIAVPSRESVLLFSYIGHLSEEVVVGERSSIDISMTPDIQTLNEVVVVGYGTQEKVNMTGAVSAVKVDDKLTSRALTNVSSGLSGLVPGLSAVQASGMAGGNNATLLIRGLGSVNGSGPLIVVDGMPDVDINRLNFNDIESISVLKDASSGAVYGSRGANGVILITTKSGKGQQKTSINYTGSYAVEQPTKAYDFMANYPRALTIHQRAAAVNTLRANNQFKDGTIDQWMAMGMVDPLRYPNTDWWDIITRQGTIANHNVSISGGNDKSNFYISGGMMNQNGIQINNDFTRYNVRFNYDYKVRNNINTGIKFNGNWSKFSYALEDGFTDDNPTNTAGFDMQYAIAGITPYDPTTGYYGGVMAYGEDPQAYNPYTVYQNTLNYQDRQEVNPSLYFDWTPIKGLTARVDYMLNYYNQFRDTAPIPNRAYNFQSNSFGSRVFVGDNAGIANFTNTGYKTQLMSRLTYTTTIAKHHNLSALVVYSEEYWFDRNQASSRNDRLNPSLSEIDAALPGIQSTGGSSGTEGLRSYIGRVNYSAFDRYLFEASFRYDGSSKFLPGNQFGYFPSASVGWRFTEENFMTSVNWLTSGKLRASYGALGNNSGVGRFEQQNTLAEGSYMADGFIAKGIIDKKLTNPALSWESTKVMDIGLELGFLNNRLTAEIDYYDRLTTGMLLKSQMSVLLSGGYDAPRTNIGDIRNRGIEGNFTWRDQIGAITYSVNVNGSYNGNRVEKWSEFLAKGAQYTDVSTSYTYNVFLNMPYNYVYTYEDAGIAQTWQDVYNATPQGASPGDLLRKDLNGDGRIDANDKKAYPRISRDRPTTNYGMNFRAAWKGFDVSVLLQGSSGRMDHWLNNYNNVNIPGQRYASTWDTWNNPWSVENRSGAWPRLNGPGGNREDTSFWLDDMSYLRMKNLQIGYRITANILSKIGVTNLRIYGSAENIATWTKYRGLDPEKIGSKSDAYPINKSYAVGINVGI
jgi:TonB-linked SusC/RagA family outer membrane protein